MPAVHSAFRPFPTETMRLRSHFLAAIFSALCVTSLLAQRDKEPKRPKLDAGADTNDARAYYDFAIERLRGEPDKAADALYWATRLDPNWADGFYARRIALLLSDPRRLLKYWSGDKRTIQSDDVRRIDSLFYRALTISPFVSQRLDRMLFERVADEIASEYERRGIANAGEVRYAIDRQMMSAPTATKAWLAYGAGQFDTAAALYARAIKEDKRNGPLHLERARVFYQLQQPDSALAELTAGVDDLRKRDQKELIYVYQSKALTEHSIAVVQSRLGHDDAAKEALGRALQEDLSYYPAHLQLAFMALDRQDTTTALTEMDLAVQLRGDDAPARYLYGYALASVGRREEAATQLRKAIELNAVFAASYFVLGETLEKLGKTPEAVAAYREFVARSAKSDPRRAQAEAKLASLAPR